MTMLPPIPLASIALALGALGGVSGAHMTGGAEQDWRPAQSAPLAQAAVVDPEDAPHADTGSHHVVRRAPDGMFYVWAKVNNRPIRFLIDTGASVVVLRAADAEAIGARTGSYNGHMQTASGGTAMAWTRLNEVVIGDHRATGLRAAVVSHGLEVSLLGANMLSKIGAVKIEGNRLELG